MASHDAPSPRTTAAHLELLRRLTQAVAISGDEGAVRQIVRNQIEAVADDVQVDALGNLLAYRRGIGRNRVRVMVAAHMDEVGLMVLGADREGLLVFDKVGGLDTRQLAAKPVWVGSQRVPGVIGARPIHMTTEAERERAIEAEDLRIDIGADTQQEAMARVTPGDRAAFATSFARLGPTVRAKALDDRLGVAALIELVRNPPPSIDLLAAFTVQEEIGSRGARVAAHRLQPEAAIVLEATPARDLPTWDERENIHFNVCLGAGPVVYLADGRTLHDPRLTALLMETAEAEQIRFQIRQPGRGSTDARWIQAAGAGVPAVALSVPVRHMHAPAGIANLADWRASVRLVHAALGRLTAARLRRR